LTSPFPTAPDLTGRDATDPASLLAQADWHLYIDSRRAGELGQAALDALRHRRTAALRGDAHFHIGLALLRAGQVTPALEHNELARGSFAAHDDARGLLMCEQFDALNLHVRGQLQDALALHVRILARSAGVARRPTDLWNLGEAQKLSEQALDMAEAAGAWTAFAVAAFNLAQYHDGLGLAAPCAALLERIRRNEHRMAPGVLAKNTSLMAIAHLCAGDVEGARTWLDRGVTAMFSDHDGKTDFARAQATWLMATSRPQEARAVIHGSHRRDGGRRAQGSALRAHAPAAGGHGRVRAPARPRRGAAHAARGAGAGAGAVRDPRGSEHARRRSARRSTAGAWPHSISRWRSACASRNT
jgi:tetratricopeptide (TPR) repeat protein